MNQTPGTESGTKRAAVVVNPTKNVAGNLQEELRTACQELGWADPLWLETTAEDPGTGQARQALADGVDLVLAAGGDGTIRTVAEVLAGTDTPLGLIPLGTGNLLARNLGLDINDVQAAARDALGGTDRRIDVVWASVDHSADEQVFLVMAGLGYDAAIMGDTNDKLKDAAGWLAYVDAGIRNLPGKPVRTRISIDGAPPLIRRMRSVMGGNCGKLQGGVEIFPGAKFDDGILDLVSLAPSGKLGWLTVLAGLLRRGRAKDPAVEYYQGKSIAIGTHSPQDIQLDGDHIGTGSHLVMRIDPGALLVRTPAAMQ